MSFGVPNEWEMLLQGLNVENKVTAAFRKAAFRIGNVTM